jgi:trimeric autotransporter adhesin
MNMFVPDRFADAKRAVGLKHSPRPGAGIVRAAGIAVLTLCFATSAYAQVTGTKNIPGDYADLAAAITDVNTNGVGSGGATLNVLAGNPQLAPVTGYVIATTTASAANPLAIVGNGNAINASFTLTPGAINDAIIKIVGTDNVTISGCTILENIGNTITTTASNNMTEFGIALFYATPTDNAQNITLQGNTISLNRASNNTFGIYANATHTAAAVGTTASGTGATGGNSGLRIYSNTINNVNNGIVVIGPTAAADANDGVDIGGASAATGNTLSNYGTGSAASIFTNAPSASIAGVTVRNSKNYNVSFNAISSSTASTIPTATSSGTLRAVYVPAASIVPLGTITNSINNNVIALRAGAAATVLQGIIVEATNGNATTTNNINNNNFTDFSFNISGTTNAQLISSLAVVLNSNVNNNNFTNLTVNNNLAVGFIAHGFTLPTGGTKNVNNNAIVTAFNKTVAGGTVTLHSDSASSPAGTFSNNNNNNFSNITVTGNTAIAGWSNLDGAGVSPVTKTVTGNTFTNWTNGAGTSTLTGMNIGFGGTMNVANNLVSNFSGGGTLTGIATSSGVTGNFTQNTIHTFSSTGANNVTGLSCTGGTTVNLARNKVYNLTGTNASSAAFGITVSSGTTVNVNNNIVGDLFLPNSGANNSIAGLNISGGTTVNASFNTVRLAATSVGLNFGSAAVLVSATPTVTLRNNNFVNLSTAAGTGLTSAYRRSSAILTSYGATSDNNNFYAGTPGASNVIFFDGTNSDQTLVAYKGRVAARDSASVTENPPFVSTVASAATFLHISSATATQLEGNATSVAGITDDFDGDVRNATTPDIGADEFNGIQLDLNGPAISYTAFPNTTLFSNRVLSVSINDPSGVAGGGNAPRIYFRKNAGGYFSTQCTGSAPSFSCTIDNALLGGVVTTDVVNYFVIAQDVPGNVSASPGVGLVAANVTTVTTPPTTPSTYTIATPFPSTVNVGTAETITSLTNAGGLFALINAGVITSNVVVNITSDLAVETGANALNVLAEEPAGSNFTVKISPAGSARVITGVFNGALIRLNGASRVTIDGSIGGTGTDRSLTIQNTSVTTPGVVLIGSVATTPITNVTLKNSIIINGALTSSAVVISDATTSGAAGFFSNITIQNNDVQKAFVGVFAQGGTTPPGGSNLIYTQNTVSTIGANAVRNVGLYMQGVNGATVSQNTVGNFSAVEGESDAGIWLATGTTNATVSGNTVSNLGMTLTTAFAPFGIRESGGLAAAGTTITGNTVTNLSTTGGTAIRGVAVSSGGVTIQRNKIQGIINNNTGTFGAYGIDVSAGNNSVIQNNFVSDINHVMTGGGAFDEVFGVIGIRLGAGTGHKVYFNSVNLFGLHPGTATSALLSAAFSISSTAQTGIDVRNNIFANNITGGTTGIAHVCVFLPTAATSAMNLTMNNNAYYFGTDVARQGAGQAGITSGTNFFTTLPLLAAYTAPLSVAATNDNASLAPVTAVPFTSSTDLHVAVASAVVNLGTPIAGITTDIDNDPRSAPAPEIGADELVDPNTAPTITPAVGVTRQAGTAVSNSTIATVGDAEQTPGSLTVTAPTVPAGLTVGTIVNTTGTITANVVAACSATLGANTVGLSVSDGTLSTAGNLSVNVTANSAPVLGAYSAAAATTGLGTTVTPGTAPSDNGSVATLTASAPLFTGTLSGNPATGVITVGSAGPAGVYTVTVTATDNCGLTSTATFSLTVTNANTAPTITPAVGVTRQAGTAVSNSTIATVGDAEQTPGSLTVTAPTVPAGLTVSTIVNATGTITANVVAACSATLGANTVGLSVSDGTLSTAGNLSVNVTANSAPVLGAYSAATVTTGSGTTVTPGTAPSDNGSVATLTASAPLFTGTLTGNPATGVITVSSAGPAGSYTVTVTATDNCGLTSTATFTLTVSNANTAPTITPAVGVTRQQGSAVSNSTIANVGDAEQAPASLTVTAPTVPAGLTVSTIVNTTGTITANVVAACSATLGANTVGLSVSDGSLSTAGNLSVNVTANSAPVLGAYSAATVTTGSGTTVTPGTAPSDNGSVATLTASAPLFTGTLTGNPATGVITVSSAGPAGSYTVTVTATDNCGLTSTATFTLTVSNANTAPTITPAVGVTRQQGTAASASAVAVVGDAESSAGSLTVTAPTVPVGLTLTGIVNTTGNVSATVAAACTASVGANAVVLNVSDGSLNTNGNLSVNVTANTPPVLGSYPSPLFITTGVTTSATPSALPSDNGTIASITAIAPGFSGTFSGNVTTGVITITNPGPASDVLYNVTVTATDNCGAVSTRTFTILVGGSADLDVSKDDGVSTYRPGDLLVYTVVLRNLGPSAANGVTFTDTVPAMLVNAQWTCVAANGAACPQTGGTGSINAVVASLPATGRLTYTLQANVASPTPAQVVNTAQVIIGVLPISDPNLSNNSATDTDRAELIFSNGFEDPTLLAPSGVKVISLDALTGAALDQAVPLFSANDVNGEAVRVYGRNSAAGVELALAVRGTDGLLRLRAWQPAGAGTLRYVSTPSGDGYVLQSALIE